MKQLDLKNLELGKIYIVNNLGKDFLNEERIFNSLKNLLDKEYRHYNLNFNFEVLRVPNPEIQGMVVARKFNIGNIGNYSLLLSDCYNLPKFVDRLFDIKSTKRDSFEKIESSEDSVLRLRYRMAESDLSNSDVRYSIKEDSGPSFNKVYSKENKKRNLFRDIFSFDSKNINLLNEEELESELVIKSENSEENSLLRKTSKEKEICLNQISELILYYMSKFKEVPPLTEIEKLCKKHLSLESKEISHIMIDENIRILLSDYNNVEIKLTPLLKTLYILFLNHPEGIVLKNISDYKKEIEMIYEVIMPNRDEKVFTYSMNNLFDVTSGSLIQKISKINKCLQNIIINTGIVENYIISGKKGTPYRVLLTRDFVSMPKILIA